MMDRAPEVEGRIAMKSQIFKERQKIETSRKEAKGAERTDEGGVVDRDSTSVRGMMVESFGQGECST